MLTGQSNRGGPFDRLLVQPGSEAGYLLTDVVRRLKARHGARAVLLSHDAKLADAYMALDDTPYARAVVASELRTDSPRPDDTAVIAKARAHEAYLGCTYNTIAVAHRHFGRGYALGGTGHPRSRYSEEIRYLDILHLLNAHVAELRRLFADYRPTLVIGGPKILACVARAEGVPYRALIGSRHENLHYWAINEFFETGDFAAEYARLADSEVSPEIARPYFVERVHRDRFIRETSAIGMARDFGHKALQRVYWRLRGYEKAKGYYAFEELKHIVRRWRDARAMTKRAGRRATVRLADLAGRPFLFFPLHTEPEASVGQASPEYFSQLTAIASLSRDLPAGALLAVKETIHGVGRRPRDFYVQIADMKNVVFLDMMEYGLEVVRLATATATITGTAGMEAAVLGKPVLTFGRHNNYAVLPHVFAVDETTELAPVLRRIFLDGAAEPDRSRDGRRYLQAVINRSFDLAGFDYGNSRNYDPAVIEQAVEALERGLAGAPGRMAEKARTSGTVAR